MWVRFCDMHSGGYKKTDYKYIYIKAESEEKAVEIFEDRFEENPYGEACSCCGSNFSILADYGDSLEQVTGFERNCLYIYTDKDGERISYQEYLNLPKTEVGFKGFIEEPSYPFHSVIPLSKFLARKDVLVID